jgi:DNA-binding response OmpR family regulator
MPHLLIVEDDPLVAAFLGEGLRASGFTTAVAPDGPAALAAARGDRFECVILDLVLPGLGGCDVLRELRGFAPKLPVLVLTGRPDLGDVVSCLDLGADDYMTKPFRFAELVARVNARLRHGGAAAAQVLVANGVELDLLGRRARAAGREVALTSREFALLEALMRHAGEVLTRQQLLSDVWGYFFDTGSNIVNVYVGALRRKLGEGCIETVRNVGYRIPVRERTAARQGGWPPT